MTINNLYEKALDEMLTASSDDCQHFFVENNCVLELAYWELLHKNPQKAAKIFETIADKDIRAHWGIFVSHLVQGEAHGYPTYFELRNFFEIDLDLFFTYYLGNYIENIIRYADWLFTINPEVLKFIGRSFLVNGYDKYGLLFLKQAREYFFNDPEMHYLLAEYYMRENDFTNAQEAVRCCLDILPAYFPALSLQKKLKLNCKK